MAILTLFGKNVVIVNRNNGESILDNIDCCNKCALMNDCFNCNGDNLPCQNALGECNIYFVEVTDTKENICDAVSKFLQEHSKNDILKKARLNEEEPFGYILDCLRDYSGESKIDCYPYAEGLIRWFKIRE